MLVKLQLFRSGDGYILRHRRKSAETKGCLRWSLVVCMAHVQRAGKQDKARCNRVFFSALSSPLCLKQTYLLHFSLSVLCARALWFFIAIGAFIILRPHPTRPRSAVWSPACVVVLCDTLISIEFGPFRGRGGFPGYATMQCKGARRKREKSEERYEARVKQFSSSCSRHQWHSKLTHTEEWQVQHSFAAHNREVPTTTATPKKWNGKKKTISTTQKNKTKFQRK